MLLSSILDKDFFNEIDYYSSDGVLKQLHAYTMCNYAPYSPLKVSIHYE